MLADAGACCDKEKRNNGDHTNSQDNPPLFLEARIASPRIQRGSQAIQREETIGESSGTPMDHLAQAPWRRFRIPLSPFASWSRVLER
jgi:hypothetical protein